MNRSLYKTRYGSENRRGYGISDYGNANCEYELTSESLSVFRFISDPDSALENSRLASAEADPEAGRGLAIMNLAHDDRERFLYLAGFLSPVIQDIFFQYYLLGRTYEQIGLSLFPQKTKWAAVKIVKTGNKVGLRALCAIIKFGGRPVPCQRAEAPEMYEAYLEMLDFPPKTLKKLRQLSSKLLGKFEVPANMDLACLFAPSWSVLGCRGSGVRAS